MYAEQEWFCEIFWADANRYRQPGWILRRVLLLLLLLLQPLLLQVMQNMMLFNLMPTHKSCGADVLRHNLAAAVSALAAAAPAWCWWCGGLLSGESCSTWSCCRWSGFFTFSNRYNATCKKNCVQSSAKQQAGCWKIPTQLCTTLIVTSLYYSDPTISNTADRVEAPAPFFRLSLSVRPSLWPRGISAH